MNYDTKLTHILLKLPRKRQVRFALDCALECKHLLTDISLKALEVTVLWLEDKATTEEVKAAYNAAKATSHPFTYIAHNADKAVFNASNAVFNASRYTTYAAYYAANALNLPIEHYYTKLVNSLTEFERAIYDISDTA